MSFPSGYPFANLAAGNQPASLLDAVFAALGSASNIMCTASGTTSNVVLTPQTGFFAPTAYVTGQAFRFTAVNTMVVNPTIQVGALAALNAYMDDGATQIPVGWIANGKTYDAQYLLSLNAGAGGFIVRGALQDILNARPNVNFGNTDAVLNITVPNISGHPGGSSFWMSVPDTQSGSATAQFHSWGTGTESSLNMCHARGVAGTPTALQLGDSLGVYGMAGYSDPVNGFQSGNGASQVAVQGFVDENYTSTTKGSVFGVLAVPRGSITRNTVFKVDGNANVIIEPPNSTNNTGLALPGQGVLFMGASTAPASGKTGYYQAYVSGGQLTIENPGNFGIAGQPATTNSGAAYFASVAYGTGNVPRFSGFMARGVHGTPTATQSGDVVGQFDASGLETGAFSLSGTLQFAATENWAAGAHGTKLSVGVTAATTTAVNVGLSVLGAVSAVNFATITNSTTGTGPVISADGTDTNIAPVIKGKGTSGVSLGAMAIAPQGRLTLTTATPVMTATASGQTTVFYTPYTGNLVPIYDGTNFNLTPFSEISQLTTDATKSPAAVAASSVYDVFVWNDAGTIRATRGPAWTNITTRSAGTALTRVNGILLNNASITNGPAASRGTYVGSIASNGASTIDYIFGAAASGGTAAVHNVYNAYNRVSTGTSVTDNGVSYTYTTATIRQARASAGMQVTFLLGLQEDAVQVSWMTRTNPVSAIGSFTETGVGFDTTTAFSLQPAFVISQAAQVMTGPATISGIWISPIGVHVLSANEKGDGANANAFDSDSQATLSATIRN